ncbi:porin [uncultured Oceanisphaera sp.]|uniref:porin n=1 Tax=uncultured Oceanisphaera sp. TaxID=353858 RepID=UPI002622058E|nr:porin [uncultured Oceanisphaera sp.]
MKKTILALTIPALFATSASAVTVYSDEGAQVDIYGRVQFEAGEMHFKKTGVSPNQVTTNQAQDFGGEGEARLGVNVKYMLNNDVDLIGKLEWQVTAEGDNATGSDDISARYAWAGFRFMDTTELTFGRSQDPLAQSIYLGDIFNLFGAKTSYSSGDFEVSDKTDDQVRLSYANNGLDLRSAYAFSDKEKNTVGVNTGLENQYTLSAGYTFPVGVGLVASYQKQEFGNTEDLDVWFAGANYSIDGFYLAGLYTEKTKDYVAGELDAKGYEFTATYNVDAWTLLAQYAKEEQERAGNLSDIDSVDAVTLGVQYDLTAKAKLYAEYEINDDDADNDDLYGMGIQYNF